jgi:hypothetical protein
MHVSEYDLKMSGVELRDLSSLNVSVRRGAASVVPNVIDVGRMQHVRVGHCLTVYQRRDA